MIIILSNVAQIERANGARPFESGVFYATFAIIDADASY